MLHRKLRRKDFAEHHIQFSIALLMMSIVSLILISLTSETASVLYGGCMTISVLVHYFALVAVMWMGAEALLMFRKVVIVFVSITAKYIITVSLVCWCKPSKSYRSNACIKKLIYHIPYSGSCGPRVSLSHFRSLQW